MFWVFFLIKNRNSTRNVSLTNSSDAIAQEFSKKASDDFTYRVVLFKVISLLI